jgi:hypothetical protein
LDWEPFPLDPFPLPFPFFGLRLACCGKCLGAIGVARYRANTRVVLPAQFIAPLFINILFDDCEEPGIRMFFVVFFFVQHIIMRDLLLYSWVILDLFVVQILPDFVRQERSQA